MIEGKGWYLSLSEISEMNGPINFQKEENCWTEWSEYMSQERGNQSGQSSGPTKEMFGIDDIANNLATRNAVHFERPLLNFPLSRPGGLIILPVMSFHFEGDPDASRSKFIVRGMHQLSNDNWRFWVNSEIEFSKFSKNLRLKDFWIHVRM